MKALGDALSVTVNSWPWILAGLIVWSVAYWLALRTNSKTLGDLVLTVVAAIPVAAAVVCVVSASSEWDEHRGTAILFLTISVLLVVAAVYKAGKNDDLRALYGREIRQAGGVTQIPHWVSNRIVRLPAMLLGAAVALSAEAALIWGGWQLLQGPVTVGTLVSLGGIAVLILTQRPRSGWNLLYLSHAAFFESARDEDT